MISVAPSGLRELQLGEHADAVAVDRRPPREAERPPVPAVADRRDEHVVAGAEQVGHIQRVDEHPLLVRGPPGGEQRIGDPHAVDPGVDQPERAEAQARRSRGGLEPELPTQQGHRAGDLARDADDAGVQLIARHARLDGERGAPRGPAHLGAHPHGIASHLAGREPAGVADAGRGVARDCGLHVPLAVSARDGQLVLELPGLGVLASHRPRESETGQRGAEQTPPERGAQFCDARRLVGFGGGREIRHVSVSFRAGILAGRVFHPETIQDRLSTRTRISGPAERPGYQIVTARTGIGR